MHEMDIEKMGEKKTPSDKKDPLTLILIAMVVIGFTIISYLLLWTGVNALGRISGKAADFLQPIIFLYLIVFPFVIYYRYSSSILLSLIVVFLSFILAIGWIVLTSFYLIT